MTVGTAVFSTLYTHPRPFVCQERRLADGRSQSESTSGHRTVGRDRESSGCTSVDLSFCSAGSSTPSFSAKVTPRQKPVRTTNVFGSSRNSTASATTGSRCNMKSHAVSPHLSQSREAVSTSEVTALTEQNRLLRRRLRWEGKPLPVRALLRRLGAKPALIGNTPAQPTAGDLIAEQSVSSRRDTGTDAPRAEGGGSSQ